MKTRDVGNDRSEPGPRAPAFALREIALGASPGVETRCLVFGAGDSVLLTGDSDGTARMWSTADASLVAEIGKRSPRLLLAALRNVAFSADGRVLATQTDWGTVRTWDVTTRRPLAAVARVGWSIQSCIFPLASTVFHPSQHILLVGWSTGKVMPYDPDTGRSREPLMAGLPGITALAISPDGNRIAVGTRGGGVLLRTISPTSEVTTLRRPTGNRACLTRALCFHPDGQTLLSAAIGTPVQVWALGSSATPREFAFDSDETDSIACSPDGRLIATGSRPGLIRIWELTTLACVYRATGHVSELRCPARHPVAFSASGAYFASVSAEGRLRLFSLSP